MFLTSHVDEEPQNPHHNPVQCLDVITMSPFCFNSESIYHHRAHPYEPRPTPYPETRITTRSGRRWAIPNDPRGLMRPVQEDEHSAGGYPSATGSGRGVGHGERGTGELARGAARRPTWPASQGARGGRRVERTVWLIVFSATTP